MPTLKDVLAIIMGGGKGVRLHPLTAFRAKPAIPIAGKYRLIDIPISNCINSGIARISVLTQFNSVSLNRHVSRTYRFDSFHSGYVEILAAEQTTGSNDWYEGTADAVRKQLLQIQSASPSDVLILAGDHLYRMDYSKMVEYHWANDADITVGVIPINGEEVDRFGVLKRGDDGRIISFCEKPKTPAAQSAMVSYPDRNCCYLGSMGIYIFRAGILATILNDNPDFDDFGKDIIPYAVGNLSVFSYEFDGYWRDIGTIRSFYDTNLELTRHDAAFSFYDPQGPIYTHARFLPGSILEDTNLQDVLLGEGCLIKHASISHSVVGIRSQIGRNCVITDSIMMGADYYDSPNHHQPIGIGENCYIQGAIIDKNVSIGPGSVIKSFPRGINDDFGTWAVQDGIVVIPKNTVIPAGTVIEPGMTAKQLGLPG
ncbi:glucose-1-phosphate adenylyltransferase [Dehalogenimonas sp. THU2]|uniref:glucose-1-phosphate adenylyltransferase n=1 Tax=Dehalogenimonas sp. THU2 TaxID=3151121 RepID=UPI0032188D6A